ncbi:MAG: universal stress protein, partial [Bacteroidales bacterium]|nr:universal stress protein [Bacteroidales bacterium]
GAEIHAIAVSGSKQWPTRIKLKKYLRQVERYVQKYNVPFYSKDLSGGDAAERTVNYADEIGADLIAVVSSKAKGINLFIGDFPHQVINKSNVPVLSIRPKGLSIAAGFSTMGS